MIEWLHFKFAFHPLAIKVFKQKKRKLTVENEEECKEEWSRRKRSKISYVKRNPDKVSKVFESVKVCKNIKLIDSPSKNLIKSELKLK